MENNMNDNGGRDQDGGQEITPTVVAGGSGEMRLPLRAEAESRVVPSNDDLAQEQPERRQSLEIPSPPGLMCMMNPRAPTYAHMNEPYSVNLAHQMASQTYQGSGGYGERSMEVRQPSHTSQGMVTNGIIPPGNGRMPIQHIVPLIFRGRRERSSPWEFLKEYERYVRLNNGDLDGALHQVMPWALREEALNWYDFFLPRLRNYEGFKEAFIREYGAADYIRRLKRELDERTQHPKESLSEFVRAIAGFYDRIGEPVPEAKKVDTVLRQMHPVYRRFTYGQSYSSLLDLATAASDIQSCIYAEQTYHLPYPPATRMEASLAYYDPDERGEQPRAPNVWSVPLQAIDPFHVPDTRQFHSSGMKASFQGGRAPPTTREMEDRSPRNANPRRRSNNCFRCGQLGHFQAECHEKTQAKNVRGPSQ